MGKDNIKMILAVVAFIASIVIGFIALFIPPMGIIDASVLWFTSQMLVFCATLLGLNLSIDNFRKKIDNNNNN